MPCQGCQRRKAALVKQAKAFRVWLRKTPQQAKDAIQRRVWRRVGVRDGV
jgi:hypothetical protein